MSCRTSTKGLLVPAVHFSKLLMWEMYWWAHELNMFQIITKLFPAYEIFNTRNIPTIQAKSPQTLFLTIHNPLVNGRPSRKLLSRRETKFSNVLYAFFLIFLLDVILFHMFWCFLGYHWTSLIRLVKRANCKPMRSNQGDRRLSVTRLHNNSPSYLSSPRVCASNFFETRTTPRGRQFKWFWSRLSWMFSYLSKRKLRV